MPSARLCITFVGLAAALGASWASAVVPATPAPAAALEDSRGQPFDLSDARGRPTLIVTLKGWWCPACVAQLRALDAAVGEGAADLRVVGLTVDDAVKNRDARARLGLGVDVVSDHGGRFLRAQGMWRPRVSQPMPGFLLVNACGDVVRRWAGRRPGRDQTRAILRQVAALGARPSLCRPDA